MFAYPIGYGMETTTDSTQIPEEPNLIGYLAAVLMFITLFMKKMIPLRAMGASANVAFVIYASLTHQQGEVIGEIGIFSKDKTKTA